MTQSGFYKLSQEYINLIKVLGGKYKDNKERPVYCCIQDKYCSDIYWAIPTSSISNRSSAQLDRIRQFCKLPDRDVRSCYYHIGHTNRPAIFKISNVLPITAAYIDGEYTSQGRHLILRDKRLITEIERKLSRILFDESRHPNKYEQRISSTYSFLKSIDYTKGFSIKELTLADLHFDLLQSFNRFQEVKRCWRMENGKWVLKDVSFIEQWDDKIKEEIVVEDFTNCLQSGGFVWGVFNEHGHLIAFASLLSNFFGSKNQYIQLMQMHTSYEYRNKGIGKILFSLCVKKAKDIGAEKLYISAHSSEETQYFYTHIGCVDAEEISENIARHEPYSRQMEFVL